MQKCENCGHTILSVTNQQIDALLLAAHGDSAWWHVPDAEEVALIRGRILYSARIHHVGVATSYKDGWLKVKVVT